MEEHTAARVLGHECIDGSEMDLEERIPLKILGVVLAIHDAVDSVRVHRVVARTGCYVQDPSHPARTIEGGAWSRSDRCVMGVGGSVGVHGAVHARAKAVRQIACPLRQHARANA